VSQEEQAAYLSAQLDRWLAEPLAQKTVIEIYESLRGHSTLLARRLRGQELHRFVKSEILAAFRRGELVLMRLPHLTIFPNLELHRDPEEALVDEPTDQAVPPPQGLPEKEDGKEKTWVGIELVDQEGMPVPHARYVLELADGTQKSGKLDDNGCAQVRDLKPGTYKVTFPDFDGSEWDTL
jgi:hypothetical protein